MAAKDDYLRALYLLLPQGPAWPREADGSTSQAFLEWAASELFILDTAARALYDEADPRTAETMLDTWLDEWAMPNACMKKFGTTDFPRDQLRTMLLAQIGTWGLTSTQAINFIGKVYGKDVDVQNVAPFTVASTVNRRIYDQSWRVYVVIVSVNDNDKGECFTVNWTVDQPLRRWGDSRFECSVEQVIPAHLWPMFSYPDAAEGGTDGDLVFE